MRIAAFGDLHAPFEHKKAVEWAIRRAKKLRPQVVVQVGDLLDLYSFSKFPRAHFITPEEELSTARLRAAHFWERIVDATPGAERYQITGNHDVRPFKRVLEAAPELAPLVGKSLRELYTFPGVKTIDNPSQELIIDGIVFQHGHRSRLGDHSRYNQSNTVCGHSHTGGVNFQRNGKGTYWELNAGLLGDPANRVFSYRAQQKIHTCTLGLAIIDEDGPRFIPYKEQDK